MNSKITIRQAEIEELKIWDHLISRFANHRVSHTKAWIYSLEKSISGKPVFLIYEKDDTIAACLPGLIVKIGMLRIFGSPLPGWQTISMGPAFDEDLISTAELIAPLAPFLEKTFDVHHVEMLTNQFDAAVMENSGYRGTPEFTFTLPLFPEDEKKNLQLMRRGARRNMVRGTELGLTVEERTDEEFADEIYEQITAVFLRGGNVIPYSKKRVLEFFRQMRDSGRLIALAVNHPEKQTCIAAGLFTVEAEELTLWIWAHREEFRWYRPTELMTWTAMQKAMERGCTKFDFMGGGNFKANFGATLQKDKIRWVRSRYKWLTAARDMAEKMFRFQQSIRGRYTRRKAVAA